MVAGPRDRSSWILLVVLPTLIGGLLYVAYRPTSLVLFRWAEALQLDRGVSWIRAAAANLHLPPVVVNCAPAGLWALGFTAGIALIWGESRKARGRMWLAVPLGLGVGSELLQRLDLLSGTFDPLDVAAYIAGAVLALPAVQLSRKLNQSPLEES